MQNLKKLKGNENFNGAGITEDCTVSERKLIQEYNTEAKERTENDLKFIWHVRGFPKNRLFVKKFWKIQENTQILD